MSSPNRRHSSPRVAQRRWEDVSEWPFQCIILPLLVAFAFCLVLFLGSKQGTRLAAFKMWLPPHMPCRSAKCVRVVAVDGQGTVLAAASRPASTLAAAGGKGGALSGISGLLLPYNSKATDAASSNGAADDFGVMELPPEDKLKYDFDYWLAEGEKLAGQQSKDCDAGYGMPYVDKWRKARLEWCTATDADAATAAASAAGAVTRSAAATAAPEGNGIRRQLTESGGTGGGGHSKAGTGAATKPASSPAAASSLSKVSPISASGGVSQSKSSGDGATGPVVPSNIELFPYHDKESNLMFGTATNTVLDSRSFPRFLPGDVSAAEPGSYAAACRLGIGGKGGLLPGEEFMGLEAARRWMVDALRTEEYGKVSAACAGPAGQQQSNGSSSSAAVAHGSVDHPVLLLSRYDPTNTFRTVEEAVSAFTTLAVLRDPRVARKGIQVVLADGQPDGFHLDLWASLSRPYPLRILAQSPWPPNTCLLRTVHHLYSGSSILTSMGVAKRTTCRSPVVIAASLWLRHVLAPAIQPPVRSAFVTHGSQQRNSNNKGVVRKSVVWISRRNFEGLAQTNLTPWQDQRRFENEGEVVLELQREIWRWNDEACLRSGLTKSFGAGHHHRRLQQLRRLLAATHQIDSAAALNQGFLGGAGVGVESAVRDAEGVASGGVLAGAGSLVGEGPRERRQSRRLRQLLGSGGGGGSRCRPSTVFFDLRVVDLNDIPFYPDQLQILGHATILAGAHGTGLANMIWMAPGKGGVLELHHNSAGNDQYHNQAHLLGHWYVAVESDGDRVGLAAVAEGLRKLLDALGAAA